MHKLLELLNHKEENVRQATVNALVELAEHGMTGHWSIEIPTSLTTLLAELQIIILSAIPNLIGSLDADSPWFVCRAIDALSELAEHGMILFVEMLTLLTTVLAELQNTIVSGAIPRIIDLLVDTTSDVRQASVNALCKLAGNRKSGLLQCPCH